MSSSSLDRPARRAFLGLIFASAALMGSCQVRPLLDQSSGTAQKLAAIAYSPAKDRVSQEVRNRLIFLTAGGEGEPANPEYIVDLSVKSQSIGVLLDQSSDDPSAGRIVVNADYSLKRASDGMVLRVGHRQSVALADFSKQEFAKLRAVRDGEDRAARQVAELIRADLATFLGR
ncbi:LPS assembly lipoprotein LptE [Rhizobium halophytocola]|uniref:LPS-assembly lipoprotein n=1 Tax=Rhizobium halophytocola TaxID=735519 RepID=A0ABS4E1N9_9HYPH|nr:LPS assembly lipoprotein LptE [Rhizobium halophytocola]MBP1851860.1 LPS-assembly lipoprotein [Rhizobium halophytocola]